MNAIVKSGGDVNAANHLHEWILDHPTYEDVVYKDVWVPVVPAPRDTLNDSEEARQMDKKLSDDCYVSVSALIFFQYSYIPVPGLPSFWSPSPFGIWFCTGNH